MRSLAVIFLLFALGCDREPIAPPAAEPKHVLATVYPVAQIAQEIGGQRVTVEWFIESGQPLVEVEGTPQRRNSARLADLVISRGGTETWMRGGEDDPSQSHRIIRLETFPSAKDAALEAGIWLDPRLARELSAEIAKRLSIIDPGGSKKFEENLAKFQQQLDAICDEAQLKLSRAQQRKVLCANELFTPLIVRFGLEQALAPVETSQEFSPQRAREMRNMARSLGVPALLVSSETSPGVIRDLTDKVGLPVLTLDPLGTSAPSGRHTYLQLLRYNLDQLIAGLGLKNST